MEEKNRHITDEEWMAIAGNLYDGENNSGTDSRSPGGMETEKIMGIAGKIDLYVKLKQFDSQNAFQKVKRQIKKPQGKPFLFSRKWSFAKIAATVFFAVMLASAGFYAGSRHWVNEKPAGAVVDKNGISRIKLADGSVVTLNHDTEINYPEKFSSDVREVDIKGEAFFEVQPDPSRPFIIHAGDATIKVLGTSFNVNAYPDNEQVEVVVETGKVQVSKSKAVMKGQDKVILDPGDKGLFLNAGGKLLKSRNDNPNFLSWKTRNFIFNKVALNEVIRQLNHVYRVQIRTEDPELDHLLLTARFEDRSLDFILQVIALTHHLNIKKGDEYYVLQKSS